MSKHPAQFSVAVFAGGTGGHVYPALAVVTELLNRGIEVHWFGREYGIEKDECEKIRVNYRSVRVRGIRGLNLLRSSLNLLFMAAAFIKVTWVLWLLRRKGLKCVLGFGGFVSFPGGVGAVVNKIPLAIHEQNATMGTANRYLARFASKVFLGLPLATEMPRSQVVGNPVRKAFKLENARARQAMSDSKGGNRQKEGASRVLRLLIMGGSQGAAALNRQIPSLLKDFSDSHSQYSLSHDLQEQLSITHLAGPDNAKCVLGEYRKHQLDQKHSVEVLDYSDEIVKLMAESELIICRAGAMTIAEIQATGLPAVFIPLPHAIDGHQLINAQRLEMQGAAVVVSESDLQDLLVGVLNNLLCTPRDANSTLVAMRRAMLAMAKMDSTKVIADWVTDHAAPYASIPTEQTKVKK